jgi:hypothetical protein
MDFARPLLTEDDMKATITVCATLVGAVLFTGGAALADHRCGPGELAAGVCAPVQFVGGGGWSAMEGAYRRGYEDGRRGYDPNELVPRPPDAALDGKEGYSLGYKQQRRYVDRDGYARRYLDRDYRRRADRDYRRRADRDYYDEYYDRRFRQNDAGEAVNMATQILRRALSN